MELGQIVDYVVEWNNIHSDETDGDSDSKKKPKDTKRKATQADWDAFLG